MAVKQKAENPTKRDRVDTCDARTDSQQLNQLIIGRRRKCFGATPDFRTRPATHYLAAVRRVIILVYSTVQEYRKEAIGSTLSVN